MGKGKREAIADWLMVLGALILFASLFMTWSHQFSPSFLARYGHSTALQDVPHDPTAWQLYSVADVLLAVLAAGVLTVALRGSRVGRFAVLLGLAFALAFVIHAAGTPPTNGADLFDPSLHPPAYSPDRPTAGAGEVVALVGLGVGAVGVMLSLKAD